MSPRKHWQSDYLLPNEQEADFVLFIFRLHPTYVHAMNNLGNILKERNELIEAEQLLSKAVSIQYVVQRKGTHH